MYESNNVSGKNESNVRLVEYGRCNSYVLPCKCIVMIVNCLGMLHVYLELICIRRFILRNYRPRMRNDRKCLLGSALIIFALN